jgi:Bacteriophage Lambda NinG protein
MRTIRGSGLNAVGTTDIQRERYNTKVAVHKMIRERDAGLPCVSCGNMRTLEAGHFRVSTLSATNYHPMNLNGQCRDCNGYNGGRTYEYAIELDRRWGKGTATFLQKLSRKSEPWSIEELGTLKDAARHGSRVFMRVYFELRPHHKPTLTSIPKAA